MSFARMPFGKHKGDLLDAIDSDYLLWALGADKIDAFLKYEIQNVLSARGVDPDRPKRTPKLLNRRGIEIKAADFLFALDDELALRINSDPDLDGVEGLVMDHVLAAIETVRRQFDVGEYQPGRSNAR